jgi:hypothetical protein
MMDHETDHADFGPLERTPPELLEPRALVARAAPLWYPPATRQSWGVDGGSILDGYRPKVTLHTTETVGFPSYSGGATAPHNTVGMLSGRVEWRQHVPYNRAARALRNPAGGVQTNRANTIQLEIVWYSGRIRDLPAALYDAIAQWARWLEVNGWAPRTCSVKFTSTGAEPQRARLGPTAWNALEGYHGHEHVPENTHWDPDAIDIGRILTAEAQPPKEWWQVSIPPTELTKIAGAAADALGTTKGQDAIRRAVSAELTAALAKVGATQAFVQQTGTPQVYLMLSGQLLHIPNQEALFAIGGSSAHTKILQYPKESPVWSLPVSGAQPSS